MVSREIITQTQEARTLKETENWAWIIFQFINCWNGANSTSGPAFIKLQDWVTLTSYCLSPCLSNQTRKPIPQTGRAQQCCPIPHIPLKQLQVSHPRFITISAAQRHSSPRYLIAWNPGGKTSLHRPNIPWNCCCSCSLVPPRCSGNAALWQCWRMRNSPRAPGFNRTYGNTSPWFWQLQKFVAWRDRQKIMKNRCTLLVSLSTFLGTYFPAGTDRIWVARSWDQA